MKFLILLLIAVLLAGCGTSVPPENTAETLLPEPSAEEIPALTADFPEAEPEIRTESDEPYSGNIFYFTKLPAAPAVDEPEDETVIPSPEPEDTYRALAAVVFDFSALPSWCVDNYTNTVIFCPDELPYPDSPQYLRMTTDGIVYPADAGKFTSPMGYTADGIPYIWETREYLHDEFAETAAEYVVSLLLSEADMVNLSFCTNSHDADFENDFLRPHLDTCRTWIPDEPLTVRFDGIDNNQSPAALTADLTLPDTWILENTGHASDMKRVYTGEYSIGRMQKPAFSTEHFTGYEQLHASTGSDPVTGRTVEEVPYTIYRRDALSALGEPLGHSWYFVNIGYQYRYLVLSFLTYEDDPADYFDTVILPVIESVHIVPTE